MLHKCKTCKYFKSLVMMKKISHQNKFSDFLISENLMFFRSTASFLNIQRDFLIKSCFGPQSTTCGTFARVSAPLIILIIRLFQLNLLKKNS